MAKQKVRSAGRQAKEASLPLKMPMGKNYLLVIGIDEYDQHPPLFNAVADAKALAVLLEERYVFYEVKTLYNGAAHRENIIRTFEDYEHKIKKEDNLLIYYSGHGYYREKSKIGYLIPQDAKSDTTSHYIENTSLLNLLRSIEAHHILIILDSCFSGSLINSRDISLNAVAEVVEIIPSRYVIAAANIELASDGIAGLNSPFTRVLLEVLKFNNFEKLPASHVFYEVRKRLKDKGEKQTPVGGSIGGRLDLEHHGGEFVFYLKQETSEANSWQTALSEQSIPAFLGFEERFPESIHVISGELNEAIATIEDEQLWQKARKLHTIFAYRDYSVRSHLKKYLKEANESIKKILEAQEIQVKQDHPQVVTVLSEETELSTVNKQEDFIDPRDGQSYQTVEINGIVWMAQNLNYDDLGKGSWNLENSRKSRLDFFIAALVNPLHKFHGRLYSLEGAKNACPKGWRLPTDEEWKALAISFGGYKDLIDGSSIGNPESAYYRFKYEFKDTKFPGYYTGSDFNHNDVASFWSMTKATDGEYFNYDLVNEDRKLYRTKSPAGIGLFCRCVKDNHLIVKANFPKNDPFYNQMVFVEGGNFNLEKIFYSLDTPTPDCMVNDFYISKFLVTQAQWISIMGDPRLSRGPSWFKDDDNLPVEYISWHDAQEFVKKLNQQTGRNYRLPSEIEWGYAASGGKSSHNFKYSGSNYIDEVAWYVRNSAETTHPVGRKKPNELGLFDMNGNVSEWCEDDWQDRIKEAPIDSRAWIAAGIERFPNRVIRGGSWQNDAGDCRIIDRYLKSSKACEPTIGFRLALTS